MLNLQTCFLFSHKFEILEVSEDLTFLLCKVDLFAKRGDLCELGRMLCHSYGCKRRVPERERERERETRIQKQVDILIIIMKGLQEGEYKGEYMEESVPHVHTQGP